MRLKVDGPTTASKTYIDNTLVGEDVTFTLPEITAMIANVNAMGTMDLPVWGLFENMETTVNKVGTDKGFAKMITPNPMTLEHRWVTSELGADGSAKPKGHKAFLRVVPKIIPGIEVETGSPVELETSFTATRYQYFVDGEERFLLDRTAGIFRVNGVDYYNSILNML